MHLPPKNQLESYTSYDFEDIKPSRAYHMMNAMIVPRPIAFVTSQGNTGLVNAAPFSWFNAICTSPPILSIAIATRQSQLKDTARNILESRQFVVNICQTDISEAISKCAGDFSPEISEVELTGLDTLPSTKIKPPRIANSPIQLECLLENDITIGDPEVRLIFGRIIHTHVLTNLLDDKGRIDVMKLDPLARLNGDFYASLTNRFEIKRG